SPEGFHEVTNIIKSLLMKYLIRSKGGYYKNGVKQVNYDSDDVTNCFIYVMDRVYGTYKYKLGKPGRVKYDPSRMNIASFIHTWVRGYCSDLIKKQQRRYKHNFHKTIYLDDILENSKTPNNYIDNYNVDDLEEDLEVKDCLGNLEDLEKIKNIKDNDFEFFLSFLNGFIDYNLYNKLCHISEDYFILYRNSKLKSKNRGG
ncbi:MAG: hypothetical protein ACOC1K_02090, partial [Nanoarchaeota archaeon]